MNRNIWVYDIETMKSCFTYCAINIDTKEIVKFVIHKNRNDLVLLLQHLKECKGQIGFNNIGFDYPIIHSIMKNQDLINQNPKDIIDFIYNKAQEQINDQSFSYDKPNLWEKDYLIQQMDLFEIWHFNNVARMTSLKALEISMNFPNVMESEIHHTKEDITIEEVDSILEYNVNDILATFEFYKRSKDKINLRKDLNNKYSLNCINFSDSKIGESLVLKLYCDKTGKNPWDVKKLRTKRDKIELKDCIFNHISFKSKNFQSLLNKFKKAIIIETKGSIKESIIFNKFKYDYGTGGIHGCIKSGIYRSDDTKVIMSCDVASLYPSIGVINKLYPEHLGIEFCDVYEDILNQRIKAKKEGNMTLSDGFKLSLNSVYGKSNDKFSFLFDPLYTMKTTLNGQLMITMLCEELSLEGFQMLMVNTDGLECYVPKDKLNRYYEICKNWEQLTKLTLEYVTYNKMIISDVNNYTSISDKGKVKKKGRFVVDKEYHQDNSFRIIPIALGEYFINSIPIAETVMKHTNIYDFCGRQKFKGEDYGETHEIADNNGVLYNKIIKQQKNTRYYISKPGVTFIKQYKKGSQEVINKGYQVNIFNKFRIEPNYYINYDFYIKECYKEIDLIIDKQLEMF